MVFSLIGGHSESVGGTPCCCPTLLMVEAVEGNGVKRASHGFRTPTDGDVDRDAEAPLEAPAGVDWALPIMGEPTRGLPP